MVAVEPVSEVGFREALAALARLNAWVRSESFRHAWWLDSPRKAIYWMKREAIREAHGLGACDAPPGLFGRDLR